MKTTLIAACLAFFAAAILSADGASAAEEGKQPVFLICPHKKKFSAWSLYLTVDSANPGKVLALGLEELTGKNSEDLAPNGYEAVLAAQQDPKTARKLLGALAAKDFATGELSIKKDDALHVSLRPLGPDSYRLNVSMRINLDQRFEIGGKEQARHDVLLRFDKATGKWAAYAVALDDSAGKNVVGAKPKPISGITFPVLATGIPRVIAVVEGNPVTLMDSSEQKSGE